LDWVWHAATPGSCDSDVLRWERRRLVLWCIEEGSSGEWVRVWGRLIYATGYWALGWISRVLDSNHIHF